MEEDQLGVGACAFITLSKTTVISCNMAEFYVIIIVSQARLGRGERAGMGGVFRGIFFSIPVGVGAWTRS